MSEKMPMLKVSFYSYKGGAGRSTTSWNTIQRLVELMQPTEDEPFVIVDTDTESAGSTFLYGAKDHFYSDEGSINKNSIQQRMKDGVDKYMKISSSANKTEFFGSMYPIGTFFGLSNELDRAVLFIGADLSENSKDGMHNLDEKKQNDGGTMINNFSNIGTVCEDYGAKALFFDTPSGTQALARHSIRESDIIVCCMRPTSQFREGTKVQLAKLIKGQGAVKRKYILTPTAICVDSGQTFKFGKEERVYPKRAKDIIEKEFNPNDVILDMLKPTPSSIDIFPGPESDDNDAVFGIPEVKRFKWFEECLGRLSKDILTPNDKMAIRRYEYLARKILEYSGIKIPGIKYE